jgi:hypothetical protein
MAELDPPRHPLARELGGFLAAVTVGSLAGLLAGQLLGPRLGAEAASNMAIAVGTTLTAATHARVIHGLGLRALVPRVLMAAPLAYLVMRGVHALAGR